MINKNFDTTPVENFVNAFRDMILHYYDKLSEIVSSEAFQSLLESAEQIDQLIDLLRENAITRELIPTYGEEYRGIGKTTALIEFAKEYGFSAIVHDSEDVEELREVFEYDDIYTINDLICDIIENKNLIIDEGVDKDNIPRRYEIVTGFENTQTGGYLDNYKSVIGDSMLNGCVFTSCDKVEYSTVPTIIAFRSVNDAQRLNEIAKNKNLPIKGIYLGEILRGFNVKGLRPQVLIMTFDCHNNIESEWLDETIKCMAEGFSLIIGSGDQNIISY